MDDDATTYFESSVCEHKSMNGRDGRDGRDGRHGCRGPMGPIGPTGPKGCRGEQGPKGDEGRPCKPVCRKHTLEFAHSCGCHDVKKIYTVSDVFNILVYGFTECGKPQPVYIRKHGIEVDACPKQYVQVDLGDFIRIKKLQCADPKIRIGGIQRFEQLTIYGSHVLGEKGKLLYTYINTNDATVAKEITIPSFDTTNLTKSGDIYTYGALPFRYISVATCNDAIVLTGFTFYVYDC